jgi:hypothetical protein
VRHRESSSHSIVDRIPAVCQFLTPQALGPSRLILRSVNGSKTVDRPQFPAFRRALTVLQSGIP